MTKPISIVITTYNRERYLSEAIESIPEQTKCDFELLIWDDGSTDRSVAIATGYAKRDSRYQTTPMWFSSFLKKDNTQRTKQEIR